MVFIKKIYFYIWVILIWDVIEVLFKECSVFSILIWRDVGLFVFLLLILVVSLNNVRVKVVVFRGWLGLIDIKVVMREVIV